MYDVLLCHLKHNDLEILRLGHCKYNLNGWQAVTHGGNTHEPVTIYMHTFCVIVKNCRWCVFGKVSKGERRHI